MVPDRWFFSIFYCNNWTNFYIRRWWSISFNEASGKLTRDLSEVEGDICARRARIVRYSFLSQLLLPLLLFFLSLSLHQLFDSSDRRESALATLHQYAKTCSPCHRISINPSTSTLAQITGQNLYTRSDFAHSVITRTAPPFVSGSSPTRLTRNVGCYKRWDGHDTLFGYEIDAFHRSLLQSLLHCVVYWQWWIRYTILLLRRL